MKLSEIATSDDRELIQTIQSQCQIALTAYKTTNQFLFHKTKNRGASFFMTTQPGRRPINTPISLQKNIDKKLQTMGFKALRGNSLFCSVGMSDEEYGGGDFGIIDYIIFPVNGFNFTWSSQLSDLTIDINYIDAETRKEQNEIARSIRDMTPQQFVSNFDFHNDDFMGALQTDIEPREHTRSKRTRHPEVLIQGSLYGVDSDDPIIKKLVG